MAFQLFLFLLVVCLLLALARLGRLDWFPDRASSSQGRAKRTTLHPLLKPRSPDDCPTCRRASPASSAGGPAPVRPWREGKSRRGAPNHIDTEGFACPNHQCPYFGITEAHSHAAFRRWQAWAGRTPPHLSRPCLPQHLQCPRRHALVPPENPFSCRVAVVLSALAEGLDPSAAERVFGYRQASITAWLARAARARTHPARTRLWPSAPSTPAVG